MPDYTDPWLLPFPRTAEFADGASQIEALARAVDPLLVAQDARITALSTRPTYIRRRSADVAWGVGNTLDFNTTDKNNASFTGSTNNMTTPAVGAHAVGGLYPAVWRFDCNTWFVATTPVVGDTRRISCSVQKFDPAFGSLRTWKFLDDTGIEANNGIVLGHYNKISLCFVLDRPATFTITASWVVAGTFKANSFMSLTRIRSV
jgi:hypothetical protein